MSVVGERTVYRENNNSKYRPILQSLKETCESIVSESSLLGSASNNIDVFNNPAADTALKEWFMSEAYDIDDLDAMGVSESEREDMFAELYENDKDELRSRSRSLVSEATGVGTIGTSIAMNLAFHKNLMVKSMYAQAIQNIVTKTPKFTETIRNEYLVTPDGKRYNIALEQDKLADLMDASVPSADIYLKLPELGKTDLKNKLQGTKIDKLSIKTYVSRILVEVDDTYKTNHPEEQQNDPKTGKPIIFQNDSDYMDGSEWYKWVDVEFYLTPLGYTSNEFDRGYSASVQLKGIAKPVNGTTSDIININFKSEGDQKMFITSATGLVKGVILSTQIDSSLATAEMCSTDYEHVPKIFEVPEGTPLNTTITPDIIKDANALLNINHTAVLVEQTMKILDNYKDNAVKKHLDRSFNAIADPRFKLTGEWDMKPRQDYAHDVPEYRKKSFMDIFDSYTTKMLHALNDPDVTISVIGRDDIIRKITPTDYVYQSPGNVGSIPLDFKKSVYSSDGRLYQFLSSRKEKGDDLIVTLRPNAGNDRKIYMLYDYSFYLGNEIRNTQNFALPAMHAYERFLVTNYQPVQGRIKIKNPTGYDGYNI